MRIFVRRQLGNFLKEILRRFRGYAAKNPTANWLELYKDTKNFEGDKPLTIGYVINALIIQKLERERGFDAVKQLLQCGKREKSDANYFEVLEINRYRRVEF